MFTILFAIMESKSKKHRKEMGLPGRTKGSDISLYIGLVLDVFCFIIIFMCLYENGMIKL